MRAGRLSRRFNAIRIARIARAKVRIVSVLRQQTVAHQKELERRVCEVGFSFYPLAPQEQRPEPIHLNEARKQLVNEGVIDSVPRTIRGSRYNFYFLTDADLARVNAVLAEKIAATDRFDKVQHNIQLSGHAAERMYHQAMVEAPNMWPAPYEPGHDLLTVNGLTATHGIDLAGVELPTQVTVAGSVKNRREWVYPDSDTVWTLLATAAELNAVPLLLARRAAEPTYIFLRDVGGYVVTAMNNVIHEDVRIHRDGGQPFLDAVETLGYKDVKIIDPTRPPVRFRRVFTERLDGHLTGMHATFDPLRAELVRLAYEEGLADAKVRYGRVSGTHRKDLFDAFWDSISPTEDTPHPDEF